VRVSFEGDFSNAIEYHTQDLAIAKVGDRAGEGRVCGSLGRGHMYLNEYDKGVAYLEAQHGLAISPKLALMHSCSPTQRSTCVSPSPFTSEHLARALLLVLTKPVLDRESLEKCATTLNQIA
jgi:hypothetical protein